MNKLTEEKKEGLRQLVLTFQHFMREEIQDASQLPPSFDIFEAFAKVSVNIGIFTNATNQPLLLIRLLICENPGPSCLYHSLNLMNSK